MDIMWSYIEEGIPDGCTELEVSYLDGRIEYLCSCDLHWMKFLGEEMPVLYRLSSFPEWRDYL